MDAQDDFLHDMGGMGNGMDIMDVMQNTANEQLRSPGDEEPANGLPILHPQSTLKMHREEDENALTGRPINHKSPSPANNITINLAPTSNPYHDVTINLAPTSKTASRATSAEPFLDDDFDDFDAKDDLTKDQQKQEHNVNLARRIDQELNRVADEVMNIDEIEQQYRMTKDPNNPKNIFVLKFGQNEEQHWRLPWNPTTNLMCHMEPNKLLIEQSKYNALYIKTSITPHEYKKHAIIAKKKAMLAKKEANKKYKVNIGTPVPEPPNDDEKKKKKKPQTTKFSDDLSNNKNITNLTAPTSSSNLLAPQSDKNKPRGTFLVNNSMLVHSQQTVEQASPTDQQQLIAQTEANQLNNLHIKPPTQSTDLGIGSNGNLEVTPITAQIRPELIAHSKPAKKPPKHSRRVSLTSVGEDDEEEWNNHEDDYTDNSDVSSDDDDDYYDDDDDDDDTYDNNNQNKKRISSKLNSIQLSVSISKQEDQEVQRLDDIPSAASQQSDFGRRAYEQKMSEEKLLEEENQNVNIVKLESGKLGVHTHISRLSTADMTEWTPPKMTLEKWNAVDVWQGILYLGDEWDALNYLEIIHNKIEYFINCAAGYCAFEYEKKLKYYWLENWRHLREKEREKQKFKNGIEREKRRKNRLKKFQRENPNWIPKNKTLLLKNISTMSQTTIGNNNSKKFEELPEMVQFAMKVQPTDSPIPQQGVIDDIGGGKKKIAFKLPANSGSEIHGEFNLFAETREEYKIISDLHSEILELEIDSSDHSSMYDSCMSSDEYQYDSDEYDEYLTMSDEEIINKLCPFKFLNIYAHDWEGYRLLDLHMNDVWNFIEECRMKNMNLKKEWKIQSENMDHDMDMNMDNMNGGASNHLDKPPKISCLIFCTKNNIPMTRLNSEIGVEQNMILSQIGQSICTIIETYKSQQIIQENNIWNKQIENYQKYLDLINSKTEEEFPKKNILLNNKEKLRIKLDLVSEIKKKNDKLTLSQRYGYKYWNLANSQFWNDFQLLKTRDSPLNRLFGSSSDRSSALVLGFMIHSGIRLKQSYKALLLNKANTLRNQSFLRQLIQLDWMKHCFNKPGMKEQVKFRDEYQCLDLNEYLIKKNHYNLK